MVRGAELGNVVVVIANYEVLFAEWFWKDMRQENNRNKGVQADISTPEFSGTKHGSYLIDGDILFLELNPVLWGMWLWTRQTKGLSASNRLYVLHTTILSGGHVSPMGCVICRQAQFSWSTYTCQRLTVSRVGLRAVFTTNVHVSTVGCVMQTCAVFTANVHVSAVGCVTCWLTRSFHGQNTRDNGWLSRVYLGAVWTAKLSFISASFFIDILRLC